MRLIEGNVWSVWIRYTNPQAARVLKRVYTIAPTAEAAIAQVKDAIALTGVVEYTSLGETYDGFVIE